MHLDLRMIDPPRDDHPASSPPSDLAKTSFFATHPCIVDQAGQVLQFAGVGELVEGDDRIVDLRQPVQHKVPANETGATGDDKGHVLLQATRFDLPNPRK